MSPTRWTVFVDRNGNNVLDGGDDSGLTDAAGTRQFSVDPGTYNVCEVVQGGWTNTDPGGATACKSTGALPSQGTGSPAFGNNQKASISGQIFNDNDVNHQFGSGDTALPTTVTLYAGGVPVMSKPTNSDGTYTFAGLNTGFGYTVCAIAPAGDWTWLQTAPGAGATNCSALEFTNPAVVVNLTANTGSVDIGAQKQAAIWVSLQRRQQGQRVWSRRGDAWLEGKPLQGRLVFCHNLRGEWWIYVRVPTGCFVVPCMRRAAGQHVDANIPDDLNRDLRWHR